MLEVFLLQNSRLVCRALLRVCLIRKAALTCVVQLKYRFSLVDEFIILLNELWDYLSLLKKFG